MNTAISDAVTRIFLDTDPLGLLSRLIQTIAMVFVIIIAFNLLQVVVAKILKGRISEQRGFVVRKGVKYTGLVMAVLFVFKSIGIDTSAILGAAGIAGIVFGFAAQTSTSSFISGLFLLSEKPFRVGDAIKVDDITGVVMSVDLLSVKIRTYDNLFVRIPNETIIKTNLTTITRFPIRRLDLSFAVGYREDLERVGRILLDIAAKNTWCLDNPAPFFGVDKFDGSGIAVVFLLWFEKQNYWNLKNSIIISVKKRFEEERIEIPYQKIDICIKHDVPGLTGLVDSEERLNG
ncbi:MAG: mechanosensitive ion channel family protein [Spirochaetaceae bacterium]|jgi:small-conductance mechanosensitive channel|nr:mechanosensitive ion channel family protein [Spirochaetaceae bacterium]